jgi:hypothetical protein
MQPRIIAALVCCTLTASGAAIADTVVVNDQVQVRDSQLERPRRGITMGQVEKQFGQPVTRHPTVGAPPITRWDYSGFAVVFEHDKVIDSVVLADGAPAAPAAQ